MRMSATPSVFGDSKIELNDSHMDASIEVIQTSKAPAPVGPYSQAIRVTGGTTVYVSGCIALDTNGEMVGDGDIAKETAQVLANAKEVLAASGATFADVVKTTILLADIEDFADMNAVYANAFEGTGKPPPARSCFAVKDLPKGARVEIEWIAQIDSSGNLGRIDVKYEDNKKTDEEGGMK